MFSSPLPGIVSSQSWDELSYEGHHLVASYVCWTCCPSVVAFHPKDMWLTGAKAPFVAVLMAQSEKSLWLWDAHPSRTATLYQSTFTCLPWLAGKGVGTSLLHNGVRFSHLSEHCINFHEVFPFEKRWLILHSSMWDGEELEWKKGNDSIDSCGILLTNTLQRPILEQWGDSQWLLGMQKVLGLIPGISIQKN